MKLFSFYEKQTDCHFTAIVIGTPALAGTPLTVEVLLIYASKKYGQF